MTSINLDDLPDPDDGLRGWRFDPSNPPSTFTKAMIGRMSVADIKRLSDHETSPLDEAQQESFDAAKAEYFADFNERIRRATSSMMANISANIERSMPSVMSKLPTTQELLGFDKKKLTQIKVPSVLAPQFDAARRDLIADLAATRALTSSPLPQASQDTQQQAAPGEAQEPAYSDDSSRAAEQGPRRGHAGSQAAPPVAMEKTMDTLNERLERIESDTEQLSMLAALAGIMTAQAQNSARGSVFYILVGVATTLGGISALVGLESATQRCVALAITLGVAVLAGTSYFIIRWWQKRDLKAGADRSEET